MYSAASAFTFLLDEHTHEEEEEEDEEGDVETTAAVHHRQPEQNITIGRRQEDELLEEDDDDDDEAEEDEDEDDVQRRDGAERTVPRRLTVAEKVVLEAVFVSNRYPSRKDKGAVGSQLGLPLKVVDIWYQNRRAKERRKMRAHGMQPPTKLALDTPLVTGRPALQARRQHVQADDSCDAPPREEQVLLSKANRLGRKRARDTKRPVERGNVADDNGEEGEDEARMLDEEAEAEAAWGADENYALSVCPPPRKRPNLRVQLPAECTAPSASITRQPRPPLQQPRSQQAPVFSWPPAPAMHPAPTSSAPAWTPAHSHHLPSHHVGATGTREEQLESGGDGVAQQPAGCGPDLSDRVLSVTHLLSLPPQVLCSREMFVPAVSSVVQDTFRHHPGMVFLLNAEGRVLYCSPMVYALLAQHGKCSGCPSLFDLSLPCQDTVAFCAQALLRGSVTQCITKSESWRVRDLEGPVALTCAGSRILYPYEPTLSLFVMATTVHVDPADHGMYGNANSSQSAAAVAAPPFMF